LVAWLLGDFAKYGNDSDGVGGTLDRGCSEGFRKSESFFIWNPKWFASMLKVII